MASALHDRAASVVATHRTELLELSHQLHRDPELSFEEHRSAAAVAALLEQAGFSVVRQAYGLDTAFTATAGHGAFHVGVFAEYDALPGVGHACGHNVIAAAAVGAALALADVADDADLTVVVLGTPAEERGGGKILMAERGALDSLHAAVMVHPWPTERLEATCLAVDQFDVTFTGLEAHAAAAPWEGTNAADAMVVAQVALGLLRQQLQPGDLVHGIVTDGGAAANVIPGSVTGSFMVRAPRADRLADVRRRVEACFAAGALATGCTVEIVDLAPAYSHMVSDPDLLAAYRRSAEALGRHFDLDDAGAPKPMISTDMANVSLAVPSIHPMLKVEAHGAVNHQPDFAAACASDSADLAVTDGAVAMAWTVLEVVGDPGVRARLLERGPQRTN